MPRKARCPECGKRPYQKLDKQGCQHCDPRCQHCKRLLENCHCLTCCICDESEYIAEEARDGWPIPRNWICPKHDAGNACTSVCEHCGGPLDADGKCGACPFVEARKAHRKQVRRDYMQNRAGGAPIRSKAQTTAKAPEALPDAQAAAGGPSKLPAAERKADNALRRKLRSERVAALPEGIGGLAGVDAQVQVAYTDSSGRIVRTRKVAYLKAWGSEFLGWTGRKRLSLNSQRWTNAIIVDIDRTDGRAQHDSLVEDEFLQRPANWLVPTKSGHWHAIWFLAHPVLDFPEAAKELRFVKAMQREITRLFDGGDSSYSMTQPTYHPLLAEGAVKYRDDPCQAWEISRLAARRARRPRATRKVESEGGSLGDRKAVLSMTESELMLPASRRAGRHYDEDDAYAVACSASAALAGGTLPEAMLRNVAATACKFVRRLDESGEADATFSELQRNRRIKGTRDAIAERRAKVAAMLADGCTNQVIADTLGVHKNTIKSDRRALKSKPASN